MDAALAVKLLKGLRERKAAHTKVLNPGGGYVHLEEPRELLGLVPAHSTTDSSSTCPFLGTTTLRAAVCSIVSCLGSRGLERKCA